ncbi:MAG TPA: hypothetical protein VFV38_48675 [Ktedonobacteraceae bacterium]|nr:hypothetical protein [Ktedonobacteraceae bacterium]
MLLGVNLALKGAARRVCQPAAVIHLLVAVVAKATLALFREEIRHIVRPDAVAVAVLVVAMVLALRWGRVAVIIVEEQMVGAAKHVEIGIGNS